MLNSIVYHCFLTRYTDGEATAGTLKTKTKTQTKKKKKRTSTLRNSTTSTSSSHSSIERDLFGEAPVVEKKVFIDGVPQWLHAIYKRAKIAPFEDIYAQPFNLSPAEAHKLELLRQQQELQPGDPLSGEQDGKKGAEVDSSITLPVVQQRAVTFEDHQVDAEETAEESEDRVEEAAANEFQGGMLAPSLLQGYTCCFSNHSLFVCLFVVWLVGILCT